VETLTAFLEQRRSDLSSLTPAQGARGSVRAGHDSSYPQQPLYRRFGRLMDASSYFIATWKLRWLPEKHCCRCRSGVDLPAETPHSVSVPRPPG
jgi:hypothetical protein